MAIQIDTKTIVLAALFVNIFMIILLTGYRSNLRRVRSVDMFIRAKIFQTSFFIVWGLAMYLPSPAFQTFAVLAGNGLRLTAIVCECLAVLLLINVYGERVRNIFFGLLIAFIAAFCLAYFLNATQDLRIILFSAMAVAFIIYPLIMLYNKKNASFLRKIVGMLYLMIMIAFILRGLYAGNVFDVGTVARDADQSWISFSLFVLMILSNCGYLFLAIEHADTKLKELANIDELTHIFNRRSFNELSGRSIPYFERRMEPVSYMMFDIDDFKAVNDSFGHYMGDTVLTEVASLVKSQLRSYDYIGRYGGDEFAVFLPGSVEKDSDIVAERLRSLVESEFLHEHTKFRITISIGLVTLVPKSDTDIETLYKLADGALYEAKMAGGNRVMRAAGLHERGQTDGATG